MKSYRTATVCLLEIENSGPFFFFFFLKELMKSHKNTCLRLGVFILVSDCCIDQTSHFWMLKPK